ncbi:hypothetical protein U1Q18_006283 [Sarracenia purpurea var. burkii]
MEGGVKQRNHISGGKISSSTSGHLSDPESRPIMERLGQKDVNKEAKSISSANTRKECVTGRWNLTSLVEDLSRDSKGKGRNLGREQEGEDHRGNRGDKGEGIQLKEDGPNQYSSRREPNFVLSQSVGSPLVSNEKSVTQGFNPEDENLTRNPLLPNRDNGKHPPSRAPNWKRRARGANNDLHLEPCDGDRKKSKMGDGEGRGDEDDMEQAAEQKRTRTEKCEEGTLFYLHTVEAEAQPHQAP